MYLLSKFCIKLEYNIIDFFLIKMGVKQGDNFSFNLFKIFINDFLKYLYLFVDFVFLNLNLINCLMYVDDIILLFLLVDGL